MDDTVSFIVSGYSRFDQDHEETPNEHYLASEF